MFRFFILFAWIFFISSPASAITCGEFQIQETRCVKYLTYLGQTICAPDGMEDYCLDIGQSDDIDFGARRCAVQQRVCSDRTASKVIHGMAVPISMVGGCWKWDSVYACLGEDTVDTCTEFEANENCKVTTRQCLNSDPIAGCLEWEIGYQCITKRGSTHEMEFCGDTDVCVGGICWDTGYPPDEDFIQVITDMEIARQIGVYSPDGLDIFKGEANECRSKRGAGLKNCCSTDTKGSDYTNNSIMGDFVAGSVGYSARVGTKFVLDSLYGDTVNWIGSGMAAAANNLPGGAGFIDSISNPSFGFYGFSIGGTGTFLGTSGYQIGQGMYFNPYSFAFSIGIQVIMSAMTCNEEEAMLAMRRGARLCSPKIGDWCTKRILGVCITRKRSYCCYNSKFSRIINVQGRQQLGMSWGDSESPSCTGFTASQLAEIDFREIDMSELVDDIMESFDPSYINADRANATSNVESMKDDMMQEYCDRAAAAGALPAECQ